MKTLLITFFMLPFMFNSSVDEPEEKISTEEILKCVAHISVDCGNDGIYDYYGVVDCEFADGLKDQFLESCGDFDLQ